MGECVNLLRRLDAVIFPCELNTLISCSIVFVRPSYTFADARPHLVLICLVLRFAGILLANINIPCCAANRPSASQPSQVTPLALADLPPERSCRTPIKRGVGRVGDMPWGDDNFRAK